MSDLSDEVLEHGCRQSYLQAKRLHRTFVVTAVIAICMMPFSYISSLALTALSVAILCYWSKFHTDYKEKEQEVMDRSWSRAVAKSLEARVRFSAQLAELQAMNDLHKARAEAEYARRMLNKVMELKKDE